jgi:hypothetical protein
MTDFQQMGYNGALNQFQVDADTLVVNNLVVNDVTLSSVVPNSVLIANASNQLDDLVLTAGKVVMGTSGAPIAGSILGTTNQVIVTTNPTNLTLSLPQSIDTLASVRFNPVTSDFLIAKQLVMGDINKRLDSFTLAVNGQIPIGSSSTGGPVASTITQGSGILVTNAPGSITIAATPTTGLTAKSLVYTDASNNLASLTLTDGQLAIGSTSAIPVAATITPVASQTTVTTGSGSLIVGCVQNIASNSSPTFSSLSLNSLTNQLLTGSGTAITTSSYPAPASNITITFPHITDTIVGRNTIDILTNKTISGPLTFSSLTVNTAPYIDASSNLASVALTDGQLLIGSTSAIPVAATITPVASQTTVTTGSGSIIIGAAQNISTSSTPTFKGLSITTTGLGVNGGGISSSTTIASHALSNQLTTGSDLVHR